MNPRIIFTLSFLLIAFCLFGQEPNTELKQSFIQDTVKIASFKKKPEGFIKRILFRLTPEKLKYDIAEQSVYKTKIDTLVIKVDSNVLNSYKHPNSNQQLSYSNLNINYQGLTEKDWSLKNQIIHIPPKETTDSLTRTIYGFHPFWMGDAYKSYYFSLLSRVAYFSYNIDAKNKTISLPQGWEETEIVNLAHQQGCKVDLSVSCFGKENVSLLLDDISLQAQAIGTSIALIQSKNADGINLDFENVPADKIYDFITFIRRFSTELKKVNPTYYFSVCLPAYDWSGAFLLDEINSFIDLYIVMGYDFKGDYSLQAGPNAPLFGNNEINISNSLATWYSKGLPKQKTILAVPYFGYHWQTKEAVIPSDVTKYQNSKTYREIIAIYKELYKSYFDSTQSADYIIYNQDNVWNQIWYDDETSLTQKYDFIKSEGLPGVGIWALGYDNGLPMLWNLLKKNFTVNTQLLAQQNQQSKDHVFKALNEKIAAPMKGFPQMPKMNSAPLDEVKKKEVNSLVRMISIFALILAGFAIVGFIVALFDYNVREVLFSVNFRVIIFFMFIFIFIQIVLRIFDVLDDKDVLFMIGIVLGIGVSIITIKTINSNSKNPKDLTP